MQNSNNDYSKIIYINYKRIFDIQLCVCILMFYVVYAVLPEMHLIFDLICIKIANQKCK